MKFSTTEFSSFSGSFLLFAEEKVNAFRIDWNKISDSMKFLPEISSIEQRTHISSTMPCIRLGISCAE